MSVPVKASLDQMEYAGNLCISSWCDSTGKRVLDLSGTLALLLIALPIMAVVALAIKITSEGPVLFKQKRCGRKGQEFELLKFRSMQHFRSVPGGGLTARGDQRVTPIGRILRKWKLDELPQLLNVLRGDMSLVGPRPDLEEYLIGLSAAQREVLRLKPGITGSATLRLRHEEELLSTIPPDRLREVYVTTLLPRKVKLDLDYAGKASFATDIAILLYTAAAILH